MNDTITNRQKTILTILNQRNSLSRAEIKEKTQTSVADVTLIRDLNALEKIGYISSKGKTKGKTYQINASIIQWPVDSDLYFVNDADDRQDSPLLFQHDIFSKLPGVLSKAEKKEMEELSQKFASRKKEGISDTGFQKELERITIELSWKSSKIEGNTYTLLETEELILHHKEAAGHSKEEATMILNHKDAFTYILENQDQFLNTNKNTLLQLHTILTKGLHITTGFRTSLVGITGTTYRPLDNRWQIEESIEKLLSTVKNIQHPGEKALIAHAMIAYIQPFADGNKRTSRMLGNAILIAHDMPPLSYRSVDEQGYKKAMLLFYETNNILYSKQIFLEQFRFAAHNYF